ncbi:hypothetical protein [Paraburkholderia aromaticivorans]|uniref:hypothetical protein n=1 Tax=Paraburkholderia aromaticivorans TaxID=2026199 RepID=UPI0038BCB943
MAGAIFKLSGPPAPAFEFSHRFTVCPRHRLAADPHWYRMTAVRGALPEACWGALFWWRFNTIFWGRLDFVFLKTRLGHSDAINLSPVTNPLRPIVEQIMRLTATFKKKRFFSQ